jgi:hypothetical protein
MQALWWFADMKSKHKWYDICAIRQVPESFVSSYSGGSHASAWSHTPR